jgi:hypothetical protein
MYDATQMRTRAVQEVWLAVRKIGRGVVDASAFCAFLVFSSVFSFFPLKSRFFRFLRPFSRTERCALHPIFPALRATSESDPIVRPWCVRVCVCGCVGKEVGSVNELNGEGGVYMRPLWARGRMGMCCVACGNCSRRGLLVLRHPMTHLVTAHRVFTHSSGHNRSSPTRFRDQCYILRAVMHALIGRPEQPGRDIRAASQQVP